MTSRTVSSWSVAVVVAIGVACVLTYGMTAAVPALPQQPRDPRPNQARTATEAEEQLRAILASSPQDSRAARELAQLQEARGAIAEAEGTLRRSAESAPGESARWQALAAFFTRAGQFEPAVATLERAAERDTSNASAHHLVATFYFAKLSDPTVGREDRMSYIRRGLAAEARALAVEPDFFDALVHRSLLLRAQAENESNSARRTALLQQADDLRSRTANVASTATAAPPEIYDFTAHPAPPPPPPVPGAGKIDWVYGETSFAAADGASTPRKIKDIRPVYPPMAIRLGVEGRVVVQAAIDRHGYVASARVIESIPPLTESLVDAVRQWRFDPLTLPSGSAPVLINVEGRFFPEK